QTRVQGARDPVLEPLERLHGLVSRAIERRPLGQRLAVAAMAVAIARRSPGSVRFRRVELDGSVGAALAVAEPLEQAGETVRGQELGQRRLGDRAEPEVLER